jgi:uncharacterized protein YpmS
MPQIRDILRLKWLRRFLYLLAVILNTLILALIFSMRIRSREMRLLLAFSSSVSSPPFGFFFGVSLFA